MYNNHMGKKQLIAIVVIVICIIGGGLYVYFSNDKSTNSQQEKSQTNNPVNSEGQNSSPQPAISNKNNGTSGKYTNYSSEAVAKTSGTKILFFYAPWCPQCRAADKSIKSSKLPNNLTIFKVDYDSNQTLRKRYDVSLQTTFVKIDDSGHKVKSFVAYGEPTFTAIKRELL